MYVARCKGLSRCECPHPQHHISYLCITIIACAVLKVAVLPVLRMHFRVDGEDKTEEAEEWDEDRMWREFDLDGDGGVSVHEWNEGLDKVRNWCEIPTVTMIGLCDSVFAPILRESHGGPSGRRLSSILA